MLSVLGAETRESAGSRAVNGELVRDEQLEQPAEPSKMQHNAVPIFHCITAERRK